MDVELPAPSTSTTRYGGDALLALFLLSILYKAIYARGWGGGPPTLAAKAGSLYDSEVNARHLDPTYLPAYPGIAEVV